eukprot:c21856_g2_i2.p1 GENE.c21856_g2_i2~~c21856_g2_i2.p1  ORF type:complete len:225 (+),score=63.28 c21856_g2_i2:38-676(+)
MGEVEVEVHIEKPRKKVQPQLTVIDFISWRDPMKTGPVFAAGNFFFYLLTFGGMSFLTILSYGFLLAIAGSFLLTKLRQYASPDGGARQEVQLETYITEEHAKIIAAQANLLIYHVRSVTQSEDLTFLSKIAGFCLFVTFLSKFLSGASILYLAFLGVFLGPIIYERHQTEIDAYLVKAKKSFFLFLDKAQHEVKDQISKQKSKLEQSKKAK